MAAAHIPQAWRIPASEATPEPVYRNRRDFLALAGGALLLPALGCGKDPDPLQGVPRYPRAVERNPRYTLDRPITKEPLAAAFNNFYEFSLVKSAVWPLAKKLTLRPWTVELAGECKRKGPIDVDLILRKLPQEERLYRFRCVEAWAMAVPWIGIPMRAFLKWVEPTSNAKYVRLVSVYRPKEMPGQVRGRGEFASRFPYYEGLRIDEAANELTLLATGLYGRELPKQNGAPLRLIVPWKYGFKSAKSLVRIEFTKTRPKTFWSDYAPREYGFYANVNPKVPHPRWSQAREWLLPSRSDQRATQLFNGYGAQVAALYKGMDLRRDF